MIKLYPICRKWSVMCILATVLFSCYEDEDFSSDSSLQLTFSSENIVFDTIFASVQSPVKILKIYNSNNHSITMDSLYLNGDNSSNFLLNVNGRPGPSLGNVEVLKKDSIYVFVAVNTNIDQAIDYQTEKDEIILQWNGNTQKIPVSALQKKIDVTENLIVSSDTTITRDCYLKGKINIAQTGILHVKEGVTLYLDQSSYIKIDGSLRLDGTLAKPIVLRGANLNKAEDGILNDNHTEQWGGIVINATSQDNVFQYATLKNATQAIEIKDSDSQNTKLILNSSVVHNSLYFGIRAFNANVGIYNSRISNSYGPLIQFWGGEVELVQNTIANYFEWYKRVATPSLLLSSKVDSKEYLFSNIIIANNLIVGRRTTELELNVTSPSLTFTNNLVQVITIPEFQGTDNYWNIKDPFIFANLNTNGDYFYSFELSRSSNIETLGNASMLYSNPFPVDISGYSRPKTSKADIGCYQHHW